MSLPIPPYVLMQGKEAEDYAHEVCARLPENQRESARQRVVRALAKGWQSVGFWDHAEWNDEIRDYDITVDETDLYGVPPDEGGLSRFVPMDVEEI